METIKKIFKNMSKLIKNFVRVEAVQRTTVSSSDERP